MMADTTVDSVRRTDTQIDSKKQRTRNEEDWLQNKRKRLKVSGQEYENSAGKIIKKKTPQPVDCTRCKFSCTNLFSRKDRKRINRRFWALADYGKQRIYLNKNVETRDCHRKSAENSRRNATYHYHFGDQRVCKRFFLATLDITDRYITILKKKEKTGIPCHVDRRGHQREDSEPPSQRPHMSWTKTAEKNQILLSEIKTEY